MHCLSLKVLVFPKIYCGVQSVDRGFSANQRVSCYGAVNLRWVPLFLLSGHFSGGINLYFVNLLNVKIVLPSMEKKIVMSVTDRDIRKILRRHPWLPYDIARRMAEDLKKAPTSTAEGLRAYNREYMRVRRAERRGNLTDVPGVVTGKYLYLRNKDRKKLVLFNTLIKKTEEILKDKMDNTDKLKAISKLLKDKVSYHDWVGFYAVDKERPTELVLVSYEGEPTDHVRIPFNKGVCGRAARLKKTILVKDVTKKRYYLPCHSDVKSEIVLPIFKNKTLVGELDIDSYVLSPFNKHDKTFLTEIAKKVSDLF
jgi:putative methionine-R-sulfoxide reductase with GAF domain